MKFLLLILTLSWTVFVILIAYNHLRPAPLSPCIEQKQEHPMPKTKKEINSLTKQYNNQDKGWIK